MAQLLLIGFYNYFWKDPIKVLKDVYLNCFKDDDLATSRWNLLWIKSFIKKVP